MSYHHEFTVNAEEIPELQGLEEFANSVVIRFEMDGVGGEDELIDYDCVKINSDHTAQYVGVCIDCNYGYTQFDKAIQAACWREWENLQDGWADDAAEYRADKVRASLSDAYADMGADVPAR